MLNELKELAELFGGFDPQKAVILLMFRKPRNSHQVLRMMSKLPKKYRVPRSTLYGKVQELLESYFLRKVKEEHRKIGKRRITERHFTVSLKGFLASNIFGHLLFSEAKRPTLQEKLEEGTEVDPDKILQDLTSARGWSTLVGWLRWNRERGSDFSRLDLDKTEVFHNFLGYLIKKPENLSEELVTEFAGLMLTPPNLYPQITPEAVRDFRRSIGRLQDWLAEVLVPGFQEVVASGDLPS